MLSEVMLNKLRTEPRECLMVKASSMAQLIWIRMMFAMN